MRRRLLSVTVSLTLILALFVGLDLSFDIIPKVSSGLIEVDDSGGKDYLTIQEGVDAAIPGDTVLVYAGTYYEDVIINKTINLTGEDKDTTIVNASDFGIFIDNIDYVNISGFTVENASVVGIRLRYSNNSRIRDNMIQYSERGINLQYVNDSVIIDNYLLEIRQASINLAYSNNNLIKNNTVTKSWGGIWIGDYSENNTVTGNNCSNNQNGLLFSIYSANNIIKDNIFNYNNGIFNFHMGISMGTYSDNNIFLNNTMISNKQGFFANSVKGNILINSTIKDSIDYDIYIKEKVDLILLNTTFNRSSVTFTSDDSTLTVQWYLHVNVIDYLGNPVQNAKVKIEDNKNGSYNETYTTDGNGQIMWIPITEYTEQDPDGDTIGNKTYYTPHRILAWNDTLIGYAYPEPNINKSKTVTIILYNGTLMDLEPGWNLVSLPRVLSNTDIQTVLQSIEGYYDSVQWYNITDNNDHWKHYHISKPSFMNDLDNLNHTMGFWLHIIDSQGTTLVVFGDELISDQNITVYPGWNLVGYPSKSNKTRDIALDNLFFDTDVDSIWTYNATSKKWKELAVSDYFEVGHGYWMHSKVTKVWNVPL